MEIKEIKDNTLKQEITRKVLRDLPEWFGIEESTKEYIDKVVNYPFIAAHIKGEVAGFYSLREENKDTLDMYVLGVLKKYHNKGVGTKLQEYVNDYAKVKKYKYMMVITLAKKANNYEYSLTRKFYLKMGFVDFYQNDDIFDSHNPAQILIKEVI
ncbi:MAG: Acetyltransferase (GNAT) family protein [Candidatus Izimaplasma bacterium HR2]|nr:MAG: Acetyltransferase (GNAT) family protein [Candidatus Izimaplasma bacterium HR2]